MLDAHPAPDASARPQLPPVSVPASGAARTAEDGPAALLDTARTLLPVLEAGRPLDAKTLRDAMTRAFGGSDAQGAWVWKDAYEAAEAAVVLFVQRYGRAMRQRAGAGADGPRTMLAMLAAVAALEPSHTKRSEDQLRLQQFSTPLPLAYAALRAAAVRPGDTVMEPSAGTGMLAVMAECALGKGVAGHLHLNEIASVRAGLLAGLFAGTAVTRHNAEALADFLPGVRPTVVLMNPPFSATPGIERIRHDADLRHIRSVVAEDVVRARRAVRIQVSLEGVEGTQAGGEVVEHCSAPPPILERMGLVSCQRQPRQIGSCAVLVAGPLDERHFLVVPHRHRPWRAFLS